MTSLRGRILAVLVLAVVLTAVAVAVSSFYWARREIGALLDYQLQQHAIALSNRLNVPFSRAVITPAPDQQLLVRISDLRSGIEYYSHSGVQLPQVRIPGFSDAEAAGERWRVFALASGARIVEVAQPITVRQRLAAQIAARIMWPAAAAIPLLVALGWWVMGRVLQPTARLARDIGQRRADSLEPMPVAPLPDELRTVVVALNSLIGRINTSLEEQRRFVADAAHELRSPLTALKLQAQLMSRAIANGDGVPDMTQLNAAITRMTRMVEGLLALARLDSNQDESPREQIDLLAIASTVCQENQLLAQQRSITLKCNGLPGLNVWGDKASLHTLVTNLVDNALRYTPDGGEVEVALRRADGIELTVCDSGPGIPVAERERVFDRFYRLPGSQSSGSGIGLSIVRRIIDVHHGRVELGESTMGGLRVGIVLPAAAD
ncbi:MAG: sensor histidine kinase N-terminal domain-containing protein [Gammaproteobacteria bacterium]|nr:sensor histidine kinase N-terminal domain-containing protein [Gammaproteobacteria bacterium]